MAQSDAVEYTDGIYRENKSPSTSVLDMALNNLMVRTPSLPPVSVKSFNYVQKKKNRSGSFKNVIY